MVPQSGPRPHVHSSDWLGQRPLHSAMGQEEAVHPGSLYRNANRSGAVSEWIVDGWVWTIQSKARWMFPLLSVFFLCWLMLLLCVCCSRKYSISAPLDLLYTCFNSLCKSSSICFGNNPTRFAMHQKNKCLHYCFYSMRLTVMPQMRLKHTLLCNIASLNAIFLMMHLASRYTSPL